MTGLFKNWRWILLVVSILVHIFLLFSVKLPDTLNIPVTTEILITLNEPEPEIPHEPVREPVRESPQPDPETVNEITEITEVVTSEIEAETLGDESQENSAQNGDLENEQVSDEEIDGSPDDIPATIPEPEPEIDIDALLADYAASVKNKIRNSKQYPEISHRLGETGTVEVNFTLASTGELTLVSISTSSGFDHLDNAAIDAVRNAAPFEPIPPETERETLSMSITLVFELS
ncbi:energy transducer TonB [bacterium]|nr:energy transducer TonB [bacterium]